MEAALARCGACVLRAAFTDLLSHMVVYVPCPAVTVDASGHVSGIVTVTAEAGTSTSCLGLPAGSSTVATSVYPIARSGDPAAPQQNQAALAAARKAELSARQLFRVNGGVAGLLAVTDATREQPGGVAAAVPSPAPGAGGGETKKQQGTVALSEGPMSTSESGFTVQAYGGGLGMDGGADSSAGIPLHADGWIWRQAASACARAQWARAAGVPLVTAGWVLASEELGAPAAEEEFALVQGGAQTQASLPCLHTLITPANVAEEASRFPAGRLPKESEHDHFTFLRLAIRRRNAGLDPSRWNTGSSATDHSAAAADEAGEPAQVGACIMFSGTKHMPGDAQQPVSGARGAFSVSTKAVEKAALALIPRSSVLVSARNGDRHAWDASCTHLVVWNLSRVEKLCSAFAAGAWVLWPHLLGTATGLEEAEVSCATSASRVGADPRVWPGAARAWRLHGRPAFQDWCVAVVDIPGAAGPPCAMLERILTAGGAHICRLEPSHSQVPVPGPSTAAPSLPGAPQPAGSDDAWGSDRLLPPHVLLLVPQTMKGGAAVPDLSPAFAALRASASAAGWQSDRIAAVRVDWPLDYLSRQECPAILPVL